MSTTNNISSFEATGDSYSGEPFNIAHDGTTIALGTEPSVSLDTKDLNADWSVNIMFKTTAITQQCILSIDDGSGGRYLDIMQKDGDKVVLYYEGVETPITYTTQPLPYDAWIHVGFGVDVSENKLTFSAQSIFTDITTTVSPTVPPGRLFRWFRPVHVDDFYFNGTIDVCRICSYYESLTLTHASAAVFYSASSVSSWVTNGGVWYVGFSDSVVQTSINQASNGPDTKYHSFCRFDDSNNICANREFTGAVVSIRTNTQTTRNIIAPQQVFGMHYFERNNKLLYVDATTGTLNSFVVGDTNKANAVTVSSDGTYKLCRGELHDRYLFGSKQSAGGDHQIFRTDHEGLNEITVDCLTLLGVNAQVENFACNKDDDLLYFGHPSTRVLQSIDFDLANLTAHSLVLNSGVDSDIEYSDGWLYWANKSPLGTADNSSLWRMNLETDEYQKFSVFQNIAGSSGQQTLYVDRANNELVIVGGGLFYMTSTEIDFALPGMRMGMRTDSTVDLTWEPVDTATGYNILQNGVIIESNTAATSLHVTGLASGNDYKFTLEYTTDGTNFIAKKFYNAFYNPNPSVYYFPYLPNLFETDVTSKIGFSDPYTANELLLSSYHTTVKYDISTGIRTSLLDIRAGVGNVANRQWNNKRIYFKDGTKMYDAGVDNSRRVAAPNIGAFFNDPANLVFDHAVTTNGTGTANIFSHSATLDGSKIYYSTLDKDLWVYDVASNTSTVVYQGEGTWNIQSLVIDPLDQNTMIFTDNYILKKIDLTTLVVTELKTAVGTAHAFDFLGGVVYGCQLNAAYYKMNIDGTGFEEIMRSGINFNALYLDTINKRVLLFENSVCKVVPDATIADLPADPSVFLVTPRPISLDLAWQEVDGATAYAVTYTAGESNTILTSTSSTTKLRHGIKNLQPETTYGVYLYYSVNSAPPGILLGSGSFSTLPNLPGNYDSSSFANDDGGGTFDLSSLNAESLMALGEVMNELFDTGAEIDFKLGGRSTTAKFVKRGQTTSVEGEASIAIPFNTLSGSGQSATLTLSNSTDITVAYDESTEEVTIDGSVYSSGQSLVLDGKKVTVYNV